MGVLGYRKKTSFQTGMMAAQISEFSLILVALGVSLGQVAPAVLSTVTLVGIITIFISSYLILYSDTLYRYAAPYLGIFERKNTREEPVPSEDYPTILIGGGRIGFDFVTLFREEGRRFLVIDHDSEVVEQLERDNVAHEYGDATDPDFLDELKIHEATLVVSTVHDLETNLIILSGAKRDGEGPVFMAVAHRISHALELYEAGADYVILPHFLGGEYAASLVRRFSKDVTEIKTVREEHVAHLQARASHGHEHPQIERIG
jgi:Trk K+ transport system NAD-binding subunit